MANSKLNTLQSELKDRLLLLQEDINDIQSGDEYDPKIYEDTVKEIGFLKKTLNRILELSNE